MADNKTKKVFWAIVELDKEILEKVLEAEKNKPKEEQSAHRTFFGVTSTSTNCAQEKKFLFMVERSKDDTTHEESLKITSYIDGNENGFIVTDILHLNDDIKGLAKFGVVLGGTYFRDLSKQIELSYLDIPIKHVEMGKDKRRDNLFIAIKEYISEAKEYITKEFCYVPVNEFNTIADDCGFGSYEMKSLRASLDKDGYIRSVGGRYAILTRIKDRPERVIAFKREKLNVELPQKKEKPQTSTQGESGTDEKA